MDLSLLRTVDSCDRFSDYWAWYTKFECLARALVEFLSVQSRKTRLEMNGLFTLVIHVTRSCAVLNLSTQYGSMSTFLFTVRTTRRSRGA